MLARVHASCLVGVEGRIVDVEVHFGKGLPGLDIVGLPEAAVKESRVRVRAAITNSGFELPPRHAVLNLAPADLRKRGTSFDLAIAVALLAASGTQEFEAPSDVLFLGELSLTGELRPVRGLLPLLQAARRAGLSRAIVPSSQSGEASLVTDLDVRGAACLRDVLDHLAGHGKLVRIPVSEPLEQASSAAETRLDLADVRGQHLARRALEIAAAGNHHILFVGPPGAGKTMLARRLAGILPAPDAQERAAIATVASAAGVGGIGAEIQRPFRAPHHTASAAALIGGGDPVRPGEVTLAHCGVLFLDELVEFSRPAIESLRTTMESGVAVVARARERVTMPAAPMVVAAMNPCPCGHLGDSTRPCVCSPTRIEAYRGRLSGPMLDRFDLQVSIRAARLSDMSHAPRGESSADVRARVIAARARANEQSGDLAAELARATPDARSLLDRAGERLGLSMRGYQKTLRVARTIAHLEASESVEARHVAEALQFRLLDRHQCGAAVMSLS